MPMKKPAVTIAISHNTPGSDDGAGPGVTAGGDEGDPADPTDVTCPKCGCEFDPATGDIKGGESIGKPQDDGGDALANLFGGSPSAPGA